MDQEKIGKKINDIRKQNKLSQQAFADKLGVTPQAVSKWENGKNLPDIATLKEMEKQFNTNINDILGDQPKKTKRTKKIIFITLIIIVLITIILIILNKKSQFEFSELNSANSDFSITGSVVKTNNRTSLIINTVDYTGKVEDITYDKVECILYEQIKNKKKEITSCDSKKNITLVNYLKDLKIKMDHESSTCTMFTSSNMIIEIKAKEKNKTTTYKIPIEISEKGCD